MNEETLEEQPIAEVTEEVVVSATIEPEIVIPIVPEVIKTGSVCYYNELGDLCQCESFSDGTNVVTILEQKAENIGKLPEVKNEFTAVVYDNFYVKASVELLDVSIPINDFKIDDGYMTISQYVNSKGKTVKHINKAGTMFVQGFTFNIDGLDELRSKLELFGLELGTNIWILSPNEAREELSGSEWKQDDE